MMLPGFRSALWVFLGCEISHALEGFRDEDFTIETALQIGRLPDQCLDY